MQEAFESCLLFGFAGYEFIIVRKTDLLEIPPRLIDTTLIFALLMFILFCYCCFFVCLWPARHFFAAY